MKTKKGGTDKYYKCVEDSFHCKISEELLGKKYIIEEQFGTGSFLRMKIEEGLEVSRLNIDDKMEMEFDNREFDQDILEVGYCYNGETKIMSKPNNKKYIIKKGDLFIYKTLNDLDYFKFKYKQSKTISISMNFSAIKNAVNPIWEDKLIIDWQENIENIFKGNVLIIEKASYDLKKIAQQIDSVSINNMIGYMKLKLKTIEFITTLFEEKCDDKLLKNSEDEERVIKAKEIINKNLENPPSVKELAHDLNISIYKLQKGFKNTTGNTVYEYIKKERIEKAKYLLKYTDMAVIEIANEIGYENPSKFSDSFKQYNHITPLKYRKAHCENIEKY